MILWIESSFDSAHRLAFHPGKCRNIHGHRYRLEVGFESTRDEFVDGMLCDFGIVKAAATVVHTPTGTAARS